MPHILQSSFEHTRNFSPLFLRFQGSEQNTTSAWLRSVNNQATCSNLAQAIMKKDVLDDYLLLFIHRIGPKW